MIEAYSLYSGSSGNAYLVKSGKTSVLVDAGKSSAALCRALMDVGCSPCDISAVLITHEHSDHVSALKVFCKKNHPLIIGATPVLRAVCENEDMCGFARALPPGREFLIGEIAVCGCTTPHDSAASMCYRFRDADGDSLVIATDMGEVSPECETFLSGTKCAIIESNHDGDMLRYGPYPTWLKSRIASRLGHLSNDQCGELAVKLARGGTKGFVLAHLSRENNTPSLAYDTVAASLQRAGYDEIPMVCAGEDFSVRITVEGDKCDISRIRER